MTLIYRLQIQVLLGCRYEGMIKCHIECEMVHLTMINNKNLQPQVAPCHAKYV